MIVLPSALSGFYNTLTKEAVVESNNRVYCIYGNVLLTNEDRTCFVCGATKMQAISLQAEVHMITQALSTYTTERLIRGTYTLKEVAELTGLNKNVVKAIDEKRLRDKYTVDGKS